MKKIPPNFDTLFATSLWVIQQYVVNHAECLYTDFYKHRRLWRWIILQWGKCSISLKISFFP